MNISEATNSALDRWLGTDTWSSQHDLDMTRFYKFVKQYHQDHGYDLDSSWLLNEIMERADFDEESNEPLTSIARDRVMLASNILDFMKATQ